MKLTFSAGIMLMILLFVSGVLHPSDALALRKKSDHADMASQGPLSTAPKGGMVECSGMIEPNRQFSWVLEPGERIVQCDRQLGETVAAGDLLMKLANDTLKARYVALVEKRLSLQREQDRIALVRTRMKMTAEAIAQLKQQIKKERQVKQKIPGYLIEGQLGGWLSALGQKENEITLLKQEVDQFNRRKVDYQALVDQTNQSVAAIEERVGQLHVNAPFDGRLAKVPNGYSRPRAGQTVLILHDDQHLKVVANAWQNQLEYIQPGNRVKIFPNSFKQDFIWGTVRSIAPAERAAGSRYPVFPVVIDFEGQPTQLWGGMAVSVQIMGTQAK